MPSYIDLFAGAGGMSFGMDRAGWTCLWAQDYWADAVETYRQNMPDHKVECVDVRELSKSYLVSALEGRPDWIVGGPPCQGYSTVGRRKREDERNLLFLKFRDIVAWLRPSGFVLENVLGLRDMSFQSDVVEVFNELGYNVSFRILKAADYGVPQLRRRVVFVGHRDVLFDSVVATNVPETYVSVRDAIGDLPALRAGEYADHYVNEPTTEYQRHMRADSRRLQGHVASKHPTSLVEAISYIPDGGNRRDIPVGLQPSSGFHNSYSRLASWLPAVAVTQNMGKPSGTRCIHPTQDRGLTTREGARLQSFPDGFTFHGPMMSQRLQIANAVPPLMAEALALSLEDPSRWKEAAPSASPNLDRLEVEARRIEDSESVARSDRLW
ncbi:DNA cytosine methyltransferase [Actinomycetospora corticicola]